MEFHTFYGLFTDIPIPRKKYWEIYKNCQNIINNNQKFCIKDTYRSLV
jgi:hypothetical protein